MNYELIFMFNINFFTVVIKIYVKINFDDNLLSKFYPLQTHLFIYVCAFYVSIEWSENKKQL